MDAATTIFKQDSRRLAAMPSVAVLFLTLTLTHLSHAQQLGIRSRDKDQQLIHDLFHAEQYFKEVQWDIHNSFQHQGVAVVWTAGSFHMSGSRSAQLNQADTGLAVRIQNSGPQDAWKIAQATDFTDVARGDHSAMVSAVSNQLSEATFGITVMFRKDANSTSAAGTYETLLTGTITAP